MEKGQGGGDPSYESLYVLHMAEINGNSSHNIIFTFICSKLMKGLVQKSHFCLKYVTFISVNLNWSCVWLFLPRCFLLLFKISCDVASSFSFIAYSSIELWPIFL